MPEEVLLLTFARNTGDSTSRPGEIPAHWLRHAADNGRTLCGISTGASLDDIGAVLPGEEMLRCSEAPMCPRCAAKARRRLL